MDEVIEEMRNEEKNVSAVRDHGPLINANTHTDTHITSTYAEEERLPVNQKERENPSRVTK